MDDKENDYWKNGISSWPIIIICHKNFATLFPGSEIFFV